MIRVIHNVKELSDVIKFNKDKGNTIGFVPTMGALHEGHITLARKSKKENDLVIISIFVNPTQFNEKKDLEKYTRDLDGDLLKLMPTEIDIVFAPTAAEVYPDGEQTGQDIDLAGLDNYMEGKFRPGHFKGVAQVVKRLLDIVTPDKLYMGQKDFQQFTIIDHMIKTLNIKTTLVVCPTIREENGLAMSSRNERLSKETREKAGIIYKTLQTIKRNKSKKSIPELIENGLKKLNIPPFEPEYLTLVDGYKLTPVTNINATDYVVACVAVWADSVRLIDNIIVKK
ncbi:MAG TPA: pantoate--beta-alanine ligase [Saprospiraceae bacterium]|mgnify:CR=1 FL=1|nr:pantoate--beta-alanine ligase [Saprospiraceae bacterium]HMU02310.1 pantoate--beta-alanine ligase [Saprospiraceae bacterium]